MKKYTLDFRAVDALAEVAKLRAELEQARAELDKTKADRDQWVGYCGRTVPPPNETWPDVAQDIHDDWKECATALVDERLAHEETRKSHDATRAELETAKSALAVAHEELESLALTTPPAMAQASIDQLGAELVKARAEISDADTELSKHGFPRSVHVGYERNIQPRIYRMARDLDEAIAELDAERKAHAETRGKMSNEYNRANMNLLSVAELQLSLEKLKHEYETEVERLGAKITMIADQRQYWFTKRNMARRHAAKWQSIARCIQHEFIAYQLSEPLPVTRYNRRTTAPDAGQE